MASQVAYTKFENSSPIDLPIQSGQMNGRKIIPVSHGGNQGTGGGISLGTILLIVGIILWAVGAAQGNASMLIAGQVMVGLVLIPTGVVLAVACCLCCTSVCRPQRA